MGEANGSQASSSERDDANATAPITMLLEAARGGDGASADEAYSRVYAELRSLAQGVFREERGNTLQPTVLIHEAWLKLVGHGGEFKDRHHFLAVACLSMRQVLRDHARSRGRQKRAGDRHRVTLGDPAQSMAAMVDLVDLSDALEELATLNERHARVVSMRALGGMTIREVADVLEVSHGTVESDWSMARAWLRKRLSDR